MFKKLTKFNLQRTTRQAYGFYIFYVLLGFLLATLVGMIFAKNTDFAVSAVTIVVVIYATIIYAVIVFQKKLLSFRKTTVSFAYILFGAITAYLTYSAGLIFSFIIVSYLSTIADNSAASIEKKI
ncbi:MAG: hypothetical protein H6Q65_2261 [Firmicutes bacterium]|nr:hypothetical protein [Bacillota bacterium]